MCYNEGPCVIMRVYVIMRVHVLLCYKEGLCVIKRVYVL